MQRKLKYYLERILIETSAEHAVFAAKSGEVLEHRGVLFGMKIISITALLTGVFNTTGELSKLIDEHNFSQLFISGKEWKLFYQDITPIFLLIVLFKKRTLLGTVKVSSEKFANKVKRMFELENIYRIETSVLSGEGMEEEDLLEELFKE